MNNTCRQQFSQFSSSLFSTWVRGLSDYFKGHTSFYDVDMFQYNYKNGCLAILETKNLNSEMSWDQMKFLELEYRIHSASLGHKFKGVHCLKFSGITPVSSSCIIETFNGEYWELGKYCRNETELIEWMIANVPKPIGFVTQHDRKQLALKKL